MPESGPQAGIPSLITSEYQRHLLLSPLLVGSSDAYSSAPPLALVALATREMHNYLSGDADRVVVLHCKGTYCSMARPSENYSCHLMVPYTAGKGRTGTLAVAYMLSCGETPTPPKLQRSYTKEQWATRTADRLLEAVETIDTDGSDTDHTSQGGRTEEGAATPERHALHGGLDGMASDSQTSLSAALELHTARRMRTTPQTSKKPKAGGKSSTTVAAHDRLICLNSQYTVSKTFPPLLVDYYDGPCRHSQTLLDARPDSS